MEKIVYILQHMLHIVLLILRFRLQNYINYYVEVVYFPASYRHCLYRTLREKTVHDKSLPPSYLRGSLA